MTITIGNKPIFGNYKITIKDVTFEQFLEFASEDISCELLNGVLIIHSPANYNHESIFRFLLTFLDQLGLKFGIGRALGSRFVVKLSPKWGSEPDILFYKLNKKHLIKETYFDGLPDLIIEILSPSNREDDLTIKLPKYLDENVPEVWIIDPEAKSISIYQKDKKPLVFRNSEDIITSLTIPNIRIKLNGFGMMKQIPSNV